jgi:hypothetical protein
MADTIGDRSELASVLLHLQAAAAVVTAAEAGVMAVVTGNAAGAAPVVASLVWAGLLLLGSRRRSTRLVRWLEGSLLVWATINFALSIFLIGSLPPIVALVSGLVLPLAVLFLIGKRSQ